MAYYRRNRGTTYTNTGTRGSSGSGSSGSGRTASTYVYPDSYVNSGSGDGATPRGGDTPVVTTGNFSTINPLNPYGSSQGDIINQLLKLLGTDNGFAQLLQQLGIQTGNMNAGEIQDWNKQIMDALMQYAITQEQRDYNKSVLDEQRIYDSPTNQLARLMGAGISRDAALHLLGGSGSGAGAGSPLIGDPNALPASAIPGTQSDLNAVQKDTAIANTVFGGIQAVSGLVGLGFSIPQAIAQFKGLSMQNTLSQKALVGLQASDAVLSALENAVSIGVLSTEDIDGFSNATDALNYINDHKDTNAFAPLFQNGSFAQVYGTKLGREMFAQAWKNVRSSKDDGTILDQFIKQNDLTNELRDFDVKNAYVAWQQGLKQLVMQDEELYNLWINNEIDGVRLQIVQNEKTVSDLEAYMAGVQKQAAQRVFGDRAKGQNGIGSGDKSGVEMLAFSQWWQLCKNYKKDCIEHGAFDWEDYFRKNLDTAMFVAKVKYSQSKFQSGALDTDPATGNNPFFAAMLQTLSLLLSSGAWNAVDAVVKPVEVVQGFLPHRGSPYVP